ncbi:putative lipid-binding transport protein (Tim44 family) [Pseudoduganella lurida]|uniref:Putative lipid-binding transport protein (Tim44 family) n=1 Tax=Pseudoduganella lurida TaxID=1036180 RepID=A0A562QYM0_9BURK|nr:TIM44-like domain-containing protein [Pseudoduganella lurida]TWI61226.1 putative lipid-binding transport protein (Tim44 family) [Pseudoduganella lurida]
MKLKKLLVVATLALATLSMTAELAARPMGGGKSFGRQSQSVNRMAPRPAPAPQQQQVRPANQPTPAPAAPVKRPSPWKGILGGALLGLGLGALLSHFGLGGALASAIGSILTFALIAGAIYFVWRLIKGKSQMAAPKPAAAYSGGFGGNNDSNVGNGNFGNGNNNAGGINNNAAYTNGSSTPEIGSRLQPAAFDPVTPAASGLDLNKPGSAPAAPHQPWGVPADFDTAAFLRHAKGNFIRLQAAWDKSDVNDIREFTTPEVFAELRMQIQERGGKDDYTDVVEIEGELLGIENNGTDYLASVQFTGRIKPAPDALPEPFNEVWNLVKPVQGNAGWLLGGIQQLA